MFNQDLSTWDMNGVTRTNEMFKNATLFNRDLSAWDTSTITDMDEMFYEATSFNQNIGAWDVGALTTAISMFVSSDMTTTNYNNLLNGWVNSTRLADTEFSNDLTYTSSVSGVAHATLVNTPWIITDGGPI